MIDIHAIVKGIQYLKFPLHLNTIRSQIPEATVQYVKRMAHYFQLLLQEQIIIIITAKK